MKKREISRTIISEPANSRVKDGRCPVCDLIKSEWTRRTDWRCCSVGCTNKFQKDLIIYSWADVRIKAFKRDNYTCVKCGKKPSKKIIEYGEYSDADINYWRNIIEREYKIFKEYKVKKKWESDPKQYSTYFCFQVYNLNELIGDHIIPISLGGEEFDLKNVQTLCLKCNKIKTAKDLKDIALERKKIKNKKLNQEVLK